MPKHYKRKTDRPYQNTKPQTLPAVYTPGFMVAKLDRRRKPYRRMKDLVAEIADDWGGLHTLSAMQLSLVKQFAEMDLCMETLISRMATAPDAETAGKPLAQWTQLGNSRLGIASRSGLERRI